MRRRPGGGSAGLYGWFVAELAFAIFGSYKVSQTFWCTELDSPQALLNSARVIGAPKVCFITTYITHDMKERLCHGSWAMSVSLTLSILTSDPAFIQQDTSYCFSSVTTMLTCLFCADKGTTEKTKQKAGAATLCSPTPLTVTREPSARTRSRQQEQSALQPRRPAAAVQLCATLHSFIHKRGILAAKSVLALCVHPVTSIIEGDYSRDLRQAAPHSLLQGVQSME